MRRPGASRLGAVLGLAMLVAAGAAEGREKARRKAKRPPQGPAAEVLRVEGADLKSGRRKVTPGANVLYGERLVLGHGGRAVMRLGDYGIVRLDGPASFEFRYEGRPLLRLRLGKLLASVKGLDRFFAVETMNIVAAARDSDFFVEAEGELETYLCLCKGSVEITATQRQFRTHARSDNHKAFRFRTVPQSILQADAPSERHTEYELMELKILLRQE